MRTPAIRIYRASRDRSKLLSYLIELKVRKDMTLDEYFVNRANASFLYTNDVLTSSSQSRRKLASMNIRQRCNSPKRLLWAVFTVSGGETEQ
jgi:hypothetical protein